VPSTCQCASSDGLTAGSRWMLQIYQLERNNRRCPSGIWSEYFGREHVVTIVRYVFEVYPFVVDELLHRRSATSDRGNPLAIAVKLCLPQVTLVTNRALHTWTKHQSTKHRSTCFPKLRFNCH